MITKVLAFVRIAAAQRLRAKASVVAQMGFYTVILFIFSRLWTVALESRPIDGIDSSNFLWYLAITEWIVLSVPLIHLDIEQDVRSGDLTYRLTRPIAYPLTRVAEGFGDLLVRMVGLGVFGVGLALAYTGSCPLSVGAAVAVLILGIAAGALTLVFYATIGMLAFWIHDTRPIYWLWQKASFVLGGLIVPLELYPDWLRAIASASPFAALLHGPGRLALGASPADAWTVALTLLVWAVLASLALTLVYRRGLKAVVVGGG